MAKKLESNLKMGLKNEDAERRMRQGDNHIEGANPPNWLVIYIKMVTDPFSLLLWALIVLSIIGFILLNDSNQILLAVILFVTINSCALIAYGYEKKIYSDMDGLKKLIPQFTTVVRNGTHQTILARNIVKGDIIVLRSGEKSPADVRIT